MANITMKYSLSAKGILHIDEDFIGIENLDTGEMLNVADLLTDFKDKTIKLNVNYDEDFVQEESGE